MADLMSTLSTVATSGLTTVGSVVTTIVDTPLLLMTTGILFLGAAVGILGRLLSKS